MRKLLYQFLLTFFRILWKSRGYRKIYIADHVQMNALIREAELLPVSPVIMDIGAYHGLYAIPLGKIIQQKSGKMIAVEPVSRPIQVLQKNVRLNHLENTVLIVPMAAGDHQGETWVHDS